MNDEIELTGFGAVNGAVVAAAGAGAGAGFRCSMAGFARMTGGGASGLLKAAIRSLKEPVDAFGLGGEGSLTGSDLTIDGAGKAAAFGKVAGARTGAGSGSASTGCGGATAACSDVGSSTFSTNCSGTVALDQLCVMVRRTKRTDARGSSSLIRAFEVVLVNRFQHRNS